MAYNGKNMQYLTVNAEDYVRPGHKRLSRSVSPSLSNCSNLDENGKLERRKSASSKSLLMLRKFTGSESNLSASSKDLHKSMEGLCFGRAKKKMHRQATINEVYRPRCNTDPPEMMIERSIAVPILTIRRSSFTSNEDDDQDSIASSSQSAQMYGSDKDNDRRRQKNALSSLIKQTLRVTSAPVGLEAHGNERLQQRRKSASDENVKRRHSSVSTLAATSNDTSMAPLQSPIETQSVTTLNQQQQHERNNSHEDKHQQQQQLLQQEYQRQISGIGGNQSDTYSTAYSTTNSESSSNLAASGNNTDDGRALQRNSQSLDHLPSESHVSVRSSSPSLRKSGSSSNTAKHEQSSAAATTAAAAAVTPPEKEKKRKEVSSSRVKKLHRHFSQVSKDEKLINYFSCALVSDILLQGHLYITDKHFAFYSNVFGYVTKVVIPTSSVTKISKEKTAKIIPNAVGVATADERHVFGSFISREAAFRLMCSVCPPLAPIEAIPKVPADIEISEEYSIEDDSSCSISGNESPPQALLAGVVALDDPNQTLIRRNVTSSSMCLPNKNNDIPANANTLLHNVAGVRASAPPSVRHHNSTSAATKTPPPTANNSSHALPINAAVLITPSTAAAATAATNLTMIIAGTASSTTSASSSPTPSNSSSPPTTVMAAPKSAAQSAANSVRALTRKALLRLKFPTELHVVYLGVMLTMVLALFSVFLLYRILDIEAKTSNYRAPIEFNWRTGNDDDIFAEALKWQKELQSKNAEEAQNILTTNLEQIAKVRRSLETLSMLIHDRSSAYANSDDSD